MGCRLMNHSIKPIRYLNFTQLTFYYLTNLVASMVSKANFWRHPGTMRNMCGTPIKPLNSFSFLPFQRALGKYHLFLSSAFFALCYWSKWHSTVPSLIRNPWFLSLSQGPHGNYRGNSQFPIYVEPPAHSPHLLRSAGSILSPTPRFHVGNSWWFCLKLDWVQLKNTGLGLGLDCACLELDWVQ